MSGGDHNGLTRDNIYYPFGIQPAASPAGSGTGVPAGVTAGVAMKTSTWGYINFRYEGGTIPHLDPEHDRQPEHECRRA